MNQTTVTQERACGNLGFYRCSMDANTHKCINCGYSFGETVKVGDKITGECRSCDKHGEITVTSKSIGWNKATGSHEGGEVFMEGACDECIANWKIIDAIYDQFREGTFGRKDGHYTTNEQFVADRETMLEEFVKLTASQQKTFLRGIFHTIER